MLKGIELLRVKLGQSSMVSQMTRIINAITPKLEISLVVFISVLILTYGKRSKSIPNANFGGIFLLLSF